VDGEWRVRFAFNAASPLQVLAYMRVKGHAVPLNHKTKKPSTGKKDLARLAKRYPKDPVYRSIVNSREHKKMLGQYVDGYEPDPDGKIRTHFTRKPSTWRFASERPNVQNVIKHSVLAGEYRRQYIASPGCVLVEVDYSAIEALLVGLFAKDDDYMQAARMSVHAILASYILKSPIDIHAPDAAARIKDVKKEKDVYNRAKRIVHLSAYLGTPNRMLFEYPDDFSSLKQAAELQDTYFNTIGKKVKAWQRATIKEAHEKSYLDNAFGYRHYFWDVLHWDGHKQTMVMGTQAKNSVAFRPQSTVPGILVEAIKRLNPEELEQLRWQIHDALLFEMPDDGTLGERIAGVQRAMEHPIECLGGLVVGTEVSIGKNWGEME
jgi:DNA polymerase I